MDERDQTLGNNFYFYNAVISPANLIRKYAVKNLTPMAGLLTNAFGVRINPDFLPHLLKGREGEVEAPPIPSNWHADMAEFGATLRAVDLARDTFTMIELGCGWGCWMNNTGVAARKKGLKVKLIGVEADEGHVNFAKEALNTNGFSADDYLLYRGIAASSAGTALFPIQEKSGESWGLEPIFNLDDAQSQALLQTGKYVALEQHALEDIARDIERIDLLHVDIQGGEAILIPSAIDFLSQKVAYLFIGTHSRQIEGIMFDSLLAAGWVLEIERPAILAVGARPNVVVDGVQGWRNPRLLPASADVVETRGSLKLMSGTHGVNVGEQFTLKVKIANRSATDWQSVGHAPVHASYRWLTQAHEEVPGESLRTPLDGTIVSAGEIKDQTIKVIAPPSSGSYQLHLTLVQEGVQWFSSPDFASEPLNVSVVGRRAS